MWSICLLYVQYIYIYILREYMYICIQYIYLSQCNKKWKRLTSIVFSMVHSSRIVVVLLHKHISS